VAGGVVLAAARLTPLRESLAEQPILGRFSTVILLIVQAFVLWVVYTLFRRRIVLSLEPPSNAA
jgi:hypothetical protein